MPEKPLPEFRHQWAVVAAFFSRKDSVWLDDFISHGAITFEKVPSPTKHRSWHAGRSKVTSLQTWAKHLRQAYSAIYMRPYGVITCFPQLAVCVALFKKLSKTRPKLIAYNFNLGALRPGIRQRLAQLVAEEVDIFVVHSPEEVARYAQYLDVPEKKVRFAPLQRGEVDSVRKESTSSPFVVALGSAHRDYKTLIKAVDRLGIRTVIVTRPEDINDLPKSEVVEFRHGLSERDCHELMAQARICVTPIANMETASGQVTFVNAMMLGIPVIATRCPGTAGYIEHDRNGLLVPAFDAKALAEAVSRLWEESETRERLSLQARRCLIPDDHISPRRSALFMARSVLRDIRDGARTC